MPTNNWWSGGSKMTSNSWTGRGNQMFSGWRNNNMWTSGDQNTGNSWDFGDQRSNNRWVSGETVKPPPESVVPCSLFHCTHSNFEGYKGRKIIVDTDFHHFMDEMNAMAAEIGVTIVIMDSMRDHGRKLTGTVVEPSKISNHLVGHAIDFNLKTPRKTSHLILI